VSYSSCPLEFAERLSLLPPDAGAPPEVVVFSAVGVGAGADSSFDEELLPQPVSATRPTSAGSTSQSGVRRLLAA